MLMMRVLLIDCLLGKYVFRVCVMCFLGFKLCFCCWGFCGMIFRVKLGVLNW